MIMVIFDGFAGGSRREGLGSRLVAFSWKVYNWVGEIRGNWRKIDGFAF